MIILYFKLVPGAVILKIIHNLVGSVIPRKISTLQSVPVKKSRLWARTARGFYRDSDIIVLDEPTAAIDPIEESAIYKKFVEIAENKTAVIVTHRMGSAKIAERIVVMQNGEIAEIGAHDELVSRGGVYAEMYKAQAGWYV